jgi:hypothetical protein
VVPPETESAVVKQERRQIKELERELHRKDKALADSGGALDMLQMIDGTVVRAHRCAAGEKTEEQNQALGRSRGAFSTKINVRCNAAGLLSRSYSATAKPMK